MKLEWRRSRNPYDEGMQVSTFAQDDIHIHATIEAVAYEFYEWHVLVELDHIERGVQMLEAIGRSVGRGAEMDAKSLAEEWSTKLFSALLTDQDRSTR